VNPKGSDSETVPVNVWIWEKDREEPFVNTLRAKVSGRNDLSVESLEMAITEACNESLRKIGREKRKHQTTGERPRWPKGVHQSVLFWSTTVPVCK
jgi:hypothetical protein